MRPGQRLRVTAGLTRPFSPVLSTIAKRACTFDQRTEATQPVVFIVGPPRSGTTLLYQALTHALDVEYPCHLTALFPNAPLFGLWLGRTLTTRRAHRSFESLHGFGLGDGLRGPNEWEMYFRRTVFERLRANVKDKRVADSLAVLSAFVAGHSKKPLIVKTLNAVLYIDALVDALPSARFIAIKRDIRSTARSIYIASRREKEGKADLWYVIPAELKGLQFENEFAQIIAQIRAIRRRIDDAKNKYGADRVIEFTYQDLCSEPPKIVVQVKTWLGSCVRYRPDANLPPYWKCSSRLLKDPDAESALSVAANSVG